MNGMAVGSEEKRVISAIYKGGWGFNRLMLYNVAIRKEDNNGIVHSTALAAQIRIVFNKNCDIESFMVCYNNAATEPDDMSLGFETTRIDLKRIGLKKGRLPVGTIWDTIFGSFKLSRNKCETDSAQMERESKRFLKFLESICDDHWRKVAKQLLGEGDASSIHGSRSIIENNYDEISGSYALNEIIPESKQIFVVKEAYGISRAALIKYQQQGKTKYTHQLQQVRFEIETMLLGQICTVQDIGNKSQSTTMSTQEKNFVSDEQLESKRNVSDSTGVALEVIKVMLPETIDYMCDQLLSVILHNPGCVLAVSNWGDHWHGSMREPWLQQKGIVSAELLMEMKPLEKAPIRLGPQALTEEELITNRYAMLNVPFRQKVKGMLSISKVRIRVEPWMWDILINETKSLKTKLPESCEAIIIVVDLEGRSVKELKRPLDNNVIGALLRMYVSCLHQGECDVKHQEENNDGESYFRIIATLTSIDEGQEAVFDGGILHSQYETTAVTMAKAAKIANKTMIRVIERLRERVIEEKGQLVRIKGWNRMAKVLSDGSQRIYCTYTGLMEGFFYGKTEGVGINAPVKLVEMSQQKRRNDTLYNSRCKLTTFSKFVNGFRAEARNEKSNNFSVTGLVISCPCRYFPSVTIDMATENLLKSNSPEWEAIMENLIGGLNSIKVSNANDLIEIIRRWAGHEPRVIIDDNLASCSAHRISPTPIARDLESEAGQVIIGVSYIVMTKEMYLSLAEAGKVSLAMLSRVVKSTTEHIRIIGEHPNEDRLIHVGKGTPLVLMDDGRIIQLD
jgi:hypothetical protein